MILVSLGGIGAKERSTNDLEGPSSVLGRSSTAAEVLSSSSLPVEALPPADPLLLRCLPGLPPSDMLRTDFRKSLFAREYPLPTFGRGGNCCCEEVLVREGVLDAAIDGDEEDFLVESVDKGVLEAVLLEILSVDLFALLLMRPSLNFEDDLLGSRSFALLEDLLGKDSPNFDAVLLTEWSLNLLEDLFTELFGLLLSLAFKDLLFSDAFPDALLGKLSELPRSLTDLLDELLSKPGLT